MATSFKRKLFRFGIFFLLTLGIIYGGLCYSLSKLILYPAQHEQAGNQKVIAAKWQANALGVDNPLVEPESFELNSFDDTKLIGWYFKQPDSTQCGIVLAHGWGSNKTGMLKYADMFWDCGCDLVFFDHRGHQPSGGLYGTGGNKEKLDLLEVSEWFAEKSQLPKKKIGWMGESWGGAAVLQAAAINNEYAFVVADSPFQDWYSAVFERALERYGDGIRAFTTGTMAVVNWQTETDYEEASPLEAA